ncbi:MAG: amidohydrolase family protein [Clostridia bacterium]|nr:amidohydrolase family protein [Clostridia bacterium]
MATILIKNGRVWNGECFLEVDVLTEDNKISKIERDITKDEAFVFDAKGKIVSAGLVDAHVHMRGISSETFGIQAEMSCFPFGVTSAADGGAGQGDRALLESFMLKSLVFVPISIKCDRADFEQTEKKLSDYGDRAVGVKVYLDTEASDVSSIIPLKQTCDFARKRNLRVMVHCSNSPVRISEILDTLGEGDILTHAFHGGKNNAAEDNYESISRAKARGVIIDAGLAGNVHTDFSVFGGAIKNGAAPSIISTDITRLSAFVRGGRYGMTMCMSIARELGMSEADILRATTSAAARVLGKGDEWGYLKVGRAADIAVLDYTDEQFDLTDKAGNRVFSDKGYRCILTVSDGQIVYVD